MEIELRPGKPEDAEACGKICYEAFKRISEAHRFPPDFPNPDAAVQFMSWILRHPGFYSVIAEGNGRIVGSNFLDIRGPIAGVGPVTVDASVQDNGVGRQLMAAVYLHAKRADALGVRLVQAAFHNRSLSLYVKLGYDVREPLSCVQGGAVGAIIPQRKVRPAKETDLASCNRLCHAIHGHDRGGELKDAIAQGTARVVERKGELTAYATQIGFFGHAVAKENDDLKALIADAQTFAGPGFLVPSRNTDLLRWCLDQKLRITQPLTLMSRGFYEEPAGVFLPSILY